MLKVLSYIVIIFILIIIIAYLFITFYPGIGQTPTSKMQIEYSKRTDLFYDKQFHNISDFTIMTSKYKKNKDAEIKTNYKIPVNKLTKIPDSQGELSITWLGHSSILVQMSDKNILIDPVFSQYASPISFLGVKRFSDIPIEIENMPSIDVVLISHDHYDHLDYSTIKKMDSKIKKYIVPLGVESYLVGWGIDKNKIDTVVWWDEIRIENITFTSTPAQHYTCRNPLKRNISLWTGYYFSDGNQSIYYTGDSGYNNSFKEIYTRLGAVDVLLAENGQYNEAWRNIHMMPEESLQVAIDVQAKYYIPVHWGVFVLSDHDWFEPAKVAVENEEKLNINVSTPKIGEIVKYSEIENYKEHWWESENNK